MKVYTVKYHCSKSFPKIDKNILILGNGPSATTLNVNNFINVGIDVLCVNSYPEKNQDFFNIKPRYYCAIDPLFYTNKGIFDKKNNKNLYDVLCKIDWDMYYICLSNQSIENIPNPHIRPIYLNTIEYYGKFWRYALYDKNKANPGFQNVILAALYFCTVANTKKIYLSGVESDWHRELYVTENNDVYREMVHFYGVERIKVTGSTIKKGEYYKYAEFYSKTMREFFHASQYASHKKCLVFNLTPNSYIDVFEKINPKDVLDKINN